MSPSESAVPVHAAPTSAAPGRAAGSRSSVASCQVIDPAMSVPITERTTPTSIAITERDAATGSPGLT